LATTGGSGVWKNLNIQDIALYKGVNKLRFYTIAGGADLSYAQFSLSKPIEQLVFKPVIAVTSGKKQQIELIVNKPLNTTGLNISDFDLKINNQITSVKSVAFDTDNPRQINIAPDYIYTGNDIITITYKGSSLQSADGSALPAFSDYPVINDLPEALPVPGKIEAEAYETNVGLKLESCSDIGGGQNIGFTNPGDYLIYRIYVKDSGNYDVVVREACLDNPGKIEIQQLNSEYLPVNSVTVDMPVTGGWQTWQDVYSKIKMDNGPGFLKIRIIDNEFNLNWYKFSYIKPADTTSGNNDAPIYMYPNPVHDKLNLVVPNSIGSFKTIKIHDANGRLVSSDQLQRYTEEYEQPVNELTQGFYIIEVEVEGKIWRAKMLKI
jgi:endoglucanase